jgi:hypothetical protein
MKAGDAYRELLRGGPSYERSALRYGRRIVANEDDTGAKEVKRRPRFLTNRKRAKAELMGRLIKTTAAPVQRRTKPLSTR